MTAYLSGARVEIKPLSETDREALAALLLCEDIKKTYMIPDFSDAESLRRMVDHFLALSLSHAHFVRGIYRESELIGFLNDVDLSDGCMELGYVIAPAHWGRGYATEALGAVLDGLLGNDATLTVIRTGAFTDNPASLRVMEKCGMERLTHTEVIEYRGRLRDCIYYEKRARRTSK